MNKEIKIPLFNQSFWIVDKKQAEQYVCDDNFVSGLWTAMVFEGYRKRICLCLIKKELPEEVIIHESVHLANRLLDRIGIETTCFNDEIQAYLVPFIAKKIIGALK